MMRRARKSHRWLDPFARATSSFSAVRCEEVSAGSGRGETVDPLSLSSCQLAALLPTLLMFLFLFFFLLCRRSPAAQGHLVARWQRAHRHQSHLRRGGRHRDGQSAAHRHHNAGLLWRTHRVSGTGYEAAGACHQGCHRPGAL